jgi:hypothetical protein
MDPLPSKRSQLQSSLETILGSRNVYFQPPTNVIMQYPCIVYSRTAADIRFANNMNYCYTKKYQVTVIDRDPSSGIPDKVANLPLCTFEQFFTADGLNHDVFSLFF